MIGPGLEGAAFNAYAYGYDSGLAGQLTVSIEDHDGNVIVAPTTADIIEVDAGGLQSVYRWVSIYPPAGEYIVIWEDPDGIQAAEELVSRDVVPVEAQAPTIGPCQLWTTGEAVANTCGVELGTDNATDLEAAAEMASMLLYRLSARKFQGLCVRTVRPCRVGCGCNHVTPEDWFWRGYEWVRSDGFSCGCGCVSQVKLNGTARAIIEVTIDGEIVAPDGYRLDEYSYLVRLAEVDGTRQAWPRCQRLDLPSSAPGTFEITYLAGVDPPAIGVAAANSLACELYNAGPGAGECTLPSGVTRIIRAGLTIEKVSSVASMLAKGATGLPLVDSFMAAFNPTGALSGPMIWSPDSPSPRRMA